MKASLILPIIQIVLFTYYVAYIWTRYGVQKSISDSWYTVDKGKKWMFTILMCWGVGFPQAMAADIHSLFFFSGAFLCFVGAATAFREAGMTKTVHFVGAIGSIAFSALALMLTGIVWVLVFNIIQSVTLTLFRPKNHLWWVEILAFYSIIAGMLQYKLML